MQGLLTSPNHLLVDLGFVQACDLLDVSTRSKTILRSMEYRIYIAQ